ncbi:hypothetical protein [Aliarcobacter cryaerophilus]|uniref:hypothetical protein n=1 Tax=Aliarcobacter cryaerophilus TaxID=28198 RepID=UPI003DA23242
MYKCMTCKNKFEKPKRPGITFIWLIFIFFSMGLGLIFWFLSKKKCPYCNSETFIDTKYLQETEDGENKSISYKAQSKVKREKTLIEKVFYVIIAILGISFLIVNNAENKKKELAELEQKVKTLPVISVEENYRSYKELLENYPNNQEYKDKVYFYDTRLKLRKECVLNARMTNESSLKNKSTYSSVTMDEFLIEKFTDINTYIYQSSYTGKNDFGVEQKFVAKYKCTYSEKDNKINIEKLSLSMVK